MLSDDRLDSPRTHDEVLLVFPGKYRAPNAQVPLALLHVASPLLREGFKVRILDMRIDDFRTFEIGNPLFVGISSIHDSQIPYGIEFAKKNKSEIAEEPDCLGWRSPFTAP